MRIGWYDRYFAWNMSQFEEEYEHLLGPRKARLFNSLLPQDKPPARLLEIGAGTLPNSRYYKVSHSSYPLSLVCRNPLKIVALKAL